MKASAFEKAIDALNSGIYIDEMVYGHGNNVKAVYGHSKKRFHKWDEFGRSFIADPEEDEILPDNQVIDTKNEVSDWERFNIYDLDW